MTDQRWLESLKLGDVVAVDVGQYGSQAWRREKIASMTALYFILSDGTKIRRKDGVQPGGGGTWGHRDRIEPMTADISAHIKRRRELSQIAAIKWETVKPEKLTAVLALLAGAPL